VGSLGGEQLQLLVPAPELVFEGLVPIGRPHPGDQLDVVEGLPQEVVGPVPQAGGGPLAADARPGDDQDGSGPQPGLRPQAQERRVAVEAGHVEVEKDDIGMLGDRCRHCLLAVTGLHHDELVGQDPAQQTAHGRVIIRH